MSAEHSSSHYYGDLVRRIFLAEAVFMLVLIPFVKTLVYMPIYATLLAILVLVLLSGLTNPKQRWTSVVDLVVAAGGVLFFGYQAVERAGSAPDYFFILNLALGLAFLIALYYASKTVRGFIVS